MRKWQFGNVITSWTISLAATKLCDCIGQASRMLRPGSSFNASNEYVCAAGPHLYGKELCLKPSFQPRTLRVMRHS